MSAVPESVLGSELSPDGAAVRIDVHAMQPIFHQASSKKSFKNGPPARNTYLYGQYRVVEPDSHSFEMLELDPNLVNFLKYGSGSESKC